jgi:glycosyltransferase involved in cell wall biosynthesis
LIDSPASHRVPEFWILDDAPVFGGGQLNVLRLARFINESPAARSVRVICPGGSELAVRCATAGIAVQNATFPGFGLDGPFRILRAVWGLRRLLKRADRNAIVVGASLRTQVYAHAAAIGLREAPPIVHLMPEQDSARRFAAKLLLRRSPAVVVIGDNAADTYRARMPGVPILAVNNFLLPDELTAAAQRASRLSSIGEAPVLGVLARLIPEKGILELVDELAEAPASWSRLLIAGERQDESYARTVERRIDALGLGEKIRLLGRVDDLAAFFNQIEALIVPSVGNEGQPTVIIEAIAHGRPVIVREPIWSESFGALPVLPYRNAQELESALTRLVPPTVSTEELERSFGPMPVIEAIEQAAARSAETSNRRSR